MTQTNGHQPEKIDILIDQVGRLTESVHELKDVVTTGFADLKEITERQAQTAERQEQNISRLVEIVNRQTELVDTLIRDRQRG
jgi:hypothetical protein